MTKPAKLDDQHPQAAARDVRDVIEELKDTSGDRHTNRQFDRRSAAPDEGTEASEEHEAD